MTTAPARKLSKHIVVALGLGMIVGLIAAFMLKYGGKNGGQGKMVAQQAAATVAAQVGNDTPESVSDAKSEISNADEKAKEKLRTEAGAQALIQAQAQAQAQEQAKKRAQTEYPPDKLPFETGTITSEQLAHYKAAKDALSKAFEDVAHFSSKNSLPSNFDAGASNNVSASESGLMEQGGARSASNPSAGLSRTAPTQSAVESLKEKLAPRKISDENHTENGVAGDAANAPTEASAAASADSGVNGDNSTGSNDAGGLATSQKLVQAMMRQQLGGQTGKPKLDANEEWEQKQQKSAKVLRKPLNISAPPQTSVLQEGAVIPLVLMTALNNTLPGHVSARVTTNVYDSIHGSALAIPAGSRLEGNYNEHTLFGQKRMMFAFSRIIMPSGASIQIAAWNGGDAQGRSGVEGEIDNHLWEQFGTGLLLGVAGWLLQPNYPASGLNISTGAGSGYSSIGDAAGQTTFQTASGILSQYQNLKPEVNVAAGSKLSLIVLQDISLTDSGANQSGSPNQTDPNQAGTNQPDTNQASMNQGGHN